MMRPAWSSLLLSRGGWGGPWPSQNGITDVMQLCHVSVTRDCAHGRFAPGGLQWRSPGFAGLSNVTQNRVTNPQSFSLAALQPPEPLGSEPSEHVSVLVWLGLLCTDRTDPMFVQSSSLRRWVPMVKCDARHWEKTLVRGRTHAGGGWGACPPPPLSSNLGCLFRRVVLEAFSATEFAISWRWEPHPKSSLGGGCPPAPRPPLIDRADCAHQLVDLAVPADVLYEAALIDHSCHFQGQCRLVDGWSERAAGSCTVLLDPWHLGPYAVQLILDGVQVWRDTRADVSSDLLQRRPVLVHPWCTTSATVRWTPLRYRSWWCRWPI